MMKLLGRRPSSRVAGHHHNRSLCARPVHVLDVMLAMLVSAAVMAEEEA